MSHHDNYDDPLDAASGCWNGAVISVLLIVLAAIAVYALLGAW